MSANTLNIDNICNINCSNTKDLSNYKSSCVIIVTYNKIPNLEQINYHLMVGHINGLIIVDNSNKNEILTGIKSQFLDKISSKYTLIENHENLGMSRAINKGFKRAMEEGFEYMYLLDDDANISSTHFIELREEYENLVKKGERVGIICPIVSNNSNKLNEKIGRPNLTEIQKAITSGMLITNNTIKECGMYDENYFLEWADIEYCLRVSKHGLKIFRVNRVSIFQDFGITISKIKPSFMPLFFYNKMFNLIYFNLGIVNSRFDYLSIYPPERTKNINAIYKKIISMESERKIFKFFRNILNSLLTINKEILLFIGTGDISYIK